VVLIFWYYLWLISLGWNVNICSWKLEQQRTESTIPSISLYRSINIYWSHCLLSVPLLGVTIRPIWLGIPRNHVGMYLCITMIFSNTWVRETLPVKLWRMQKNLSAKSTKCPIYLQLTRHILLCLPKLTIWKVFHLVAMPQSSISSALIIRQLFWKQAHMYSIQFCLTHKAWDRNWRANHWFPNLWHSLQFLIAALN